MTAPSGGFELHAPEAGRYLLRVQRIGQRGWEAPAIEVVAGQITRMTLYIPGVLFELGELEAVARKPRRPSVVPCSFDLLTATGYWLQLAESRGFPSNAVMS